MSTSTGMSCTYPDTVATPFARYIYQVRAYKSNSESPNSTAAPAFQLDLESGTCNGSGCRPQRPVIGRTNWDNVILAHFTPKPRSPLSTIATDADLGKYNHFNWIFRVTLDDDTAIWCTFNPPDPCPLHPPYLDPPIGGYAGPKIKFADKLPYYFDETTDPAFDPKASMFSGFAGGNQRTSDNAVFHDMPIGTFPPGGCFTIAGGPRPCVVRFSTSLVGVQTPVGAVPTVSVPLNHFTWLTTYSAISAIAAYGYSARLNLDPLPVAGTGGIFGLQLVTTDELPISDRLLLIQAGVQGISTTPNVDKDAPITAAFPSGPHGTNGWYTGPVTVTVIATDIDGPSDVATTTYSVDGGPSGTFGVPFTKP